MFCRIPAFRLPALRPCFPILFCLAAACCHCGFATAQDFRIYTRVYSEPAAGSETPGSPDRSPVAARSLSLFRAGKVYDYIGSLGEVIVFEPAQDRFVILNTFHKLTATVSLDELKQMLKVAQNETEKHIAELRKSGDPESLRQAQALQFQLQPVFSTSFDEKRQSLRLESPSLQYTVKCAAPQSPEAADVYLRYADWICRLNYILHPQSLCPDSRLAVNASLRERKLIPVEVDLQAEVMGRIHLRAEHQVHWQLDNKDRSLIHQWDSQLKDKSTTAVSIREYQRAMLMSTARRW